MPWYYGEATMYARDDSTYDQEGYEHYVAVKAPNVYKARDKATKILKAREPDFKGPILYREFGDETSLKQRKWRLDQDEAALQERMEAAQERGEGTATHEMIGKTHDSERERLEKKRRRLEEAKEEHARQVGMRRQSRERQRRHEEEERKASANMMPPPDLEKIAHVKGEQNREGFDLRRGFKRGR